MMPRLVRSLLPLLLAAAPPQTYADMQAANARLGTIAWRLEAGNAALCRTLAPATGMTLLSLDQFAVADRAAVTAAFGFAAPLGVEAVAPGSPAARAGVRGGDAIVAIDGRAVPDALPDRPSVAGRDAALAALATGPADRSVALTLARDGADRAVRLDPLAGCRIVVEIAGPGMNARADDRVVQVGGRIVARYDDALLAAVVAHEMAHVVLRHHDRLDAAHVNRGMLATLGRSGRLIRASEDDADRLSVALLYNAGFDPQAAVSLWRDHGGDFEAAILRTPDHASPKARAAAIAGEIASIPADIVRPWLPPVLATRDTPID